jgi:hypothetical protein
MLNNLDNQLYDGSLWGLSTQAGVWAAEYLFRQVGLTRALSH